MIEIYVGGSICYTSDLDIEALARIMNDDFVKPETLIEIHLSDGCKAYVKKQTIMSFNTATETV